MSKKNVSNKLPDSDKVVIVDDRNRITIPAKIRNKLNIKHGTTLLFSLNNDGVSATLSHFSLNVCPQCGKQMPNTSNFCDNCGKKLRKEI